MADAVVDFLLEDLRQMLSRCTDLILEDMVPIEVFYEDLKFIKDFLRDSKEKINESDELKILVTHIEEVASKALVDLDMFTIISLMYEDINISERFYHVFGRSQKVRDMILEVKSIKKQVWEIYDKKLYSIAVPQEETIAGITSRVEELEDYDMCYDPVVQEVNMSATSSKSTMSRASKSIVEEETLVGFEDEAMAIMERLTEVQRQQLDVISIVGMAGLGKTTLARKLYNDPFIVYHFYIRGWIYVSKVYRKRDLLLGLLSSVVENQNDFFAMSDKKTFGEQNLGEELYKRLKGMRFLIVMDNIWNLFAWNDLRQYFPDDNNGSRILLTTQLKEVALDIKASKPPHCLRFLTKAESWDLFQQNVFLRNSCPLELRKIGMEIVERCSGLPLAIVVVAGFLAKEEKMQESWNLFADYLRWSTVGDTEDFMDILEMSYINLPFHLKPCFMYFGALQIHYEIHVWRLICFWIAQGYIRPVGQQSLEDVAEGYLMDLIDRSLIIPTKKSSDGKIKVCRIHDTLLDLCLRKALEFQQPIYQYGGVTSSSSSILYNYPFFHSHNVPYIPETSPVPHVHFLSLNTPVWNAHPNLPKSSIYKELRVFDISHFTLKNFPVVLLQLIHLRYLALQIYSIDRLPPLISNLWNLETLILRKREEGKVTIPHIWKMQKLRHLRISAPLEFEKPCCECYALNDLQTISTLSLSSLNKDVLEMTPNLRKLGLFRPLSDSESIFFPNLANLVHLQTLKLVDWRLNSLSSSIPQMGMFPPNIQKLILLGGHVDWKETSTLGLLPNLEVLKLEYNAFKGKRWETPDGGFCRLKFLKLKDMDLEQWIASSNHFPFLQQLVLDGCRGLKELPSGLCNTPTLLLIELYRPRSSAVESARKIEEERHSSGDDGLKIFICNQDED